MRKNILCVLLAGLLAVGLTACGVGEELPSPAAVPPSPTVTVPALAEPAIPSDAPVPTLSPDLLVALPDREYQPWQMAYMELLSLMCKAKLDYNSLTEEEKQSVYQEAIEDAAVLGIEHYYLYDIDKDGVPELLANYAIGSMVQCYTWQENRISSAGWIDICSGSLFTCPGENGILLYCRSVVGMTDTITMIFSLENGALQPKLLCSQERTTPAVDILWPDDLIPGAAFFGYYRICADRRTGTPLLLPVCNYDGDAPDPSQTPPEEARAEILAAIAGERPLCAVSTYEYDDDTGWTTWEEYTQPGAAYPYNDEPLEIVRHVWQDMNGDGQEECVVQLVDQAKQDAAYIDYCTVVFSEQAGTVYAYFFGISGNIELYDDGTLEEYREVTQLSFWQDQCYEYDADRAASAQLVEWVDGPPAG